MIFFKAAAAHSGTYTRNLLLAGLIAGAVAPVQAEIVIPNPLIKPQQITPVAEGATEKNKSLSMPNPGEAMALPRLPASGAPGVPTSASTDADTLRTTLAAYHVVLLSFDHATLKLATKQGPGTIDSASAGANSSSTSRKSVGSTIVVRHNGALRLMGESLRARIEGDTVEIVRVATAGGSEDIVFIGALESSAIAPYVPEVARLEKVDTQYIRSLAPEIRASSSGGGGSNGSGGNTGSQGQSSSPSQ